MLAAATAARWRSTFRARRRCCHFHSLRIAAARASARAAASRPAGAEWTAGERPAAETRRTPQRTAGGSWWPGRCCPTDATHTGHRRGEQSTHGDLSGARETSTDAGRELLMVSRCCRAALHSLAGCLWLTCSRLSRSVPRRCDPSPSVKEGDSLLDGRNAQRTHTDRAGQWSRRTLSGLVRTDRAVACERGWAV